MSKRPIGYFEADGSYNERPSRKRKPQVVRFTFDWSRQIAPQVSSKVTAVNEVVIEQLGEAIEILDSNGILPGNRLRAARRQVEMKAEEMMRKYSKFFTPTTP